eukprot:1249837-Rhodomonas_salina.1
MMCQHVQKKHKLSQWDAKTSSFPKHQGDVQQQMSSHKLAYILDAGLALFTKYNEKRDEAKAKG